jgi:phytoene/squalene synthetase
MDPLRLLLPRQKRHDVATLLSLFAQLRQQFTDNERLGGREVQQSMATTLALINAIAVPEPPSQPLPSPWRESRELFNRHRLGRTELIAWYDGVQLAAVRRGFRDHVVWTQYRRQVIDGPGRLLLTVLGVQPTALTDPHWASAANGWATTEWLLQLRQALLDGRLPFPQERFLGVPLDPPAIQNAQLNPPLTNAIQQLATEAIQQLQTATPLLNHFPPDGTRRWATQQLTHQITIAQAIKNDPQTAYANPTKLLPTWSQRLRTLLIPPPTT